MTDITPTDKLVSIILKHLGEQYRLYREEVRGYEGFMVASATIFVLFLVGEFTVAKDLRDILLFVPFTVISYSALLGLLFVYAIIAALYSELIEMKMNKLLNLTLFQFENYYVGPKKGRGEIFPFAIFYCLVTVMPISITYYALKQLVDDHKISSCTAYVLFLSAMLGVAFTLFAVGKVITIRKKMNRDLFEKWEKEIEDTLQSCKDTVTKDKGNKKDKLQNE